MRDSGGSIILRKYSPGAFLYSWARPDGSVIGKQENTPLAQLMPVRLHEGWSRTPIEPNGATYKIRFDWRQSQAASAVLATEGMTEVIHVKLNGRNLGMRFTYPFRFDLGAALRPGSNELELTHIERHTFTSKLGEIWLRPYYELRV